MSPLHVTIVGGTGFVGRHLADRLLRAGHRLTLVARHCPSSGAAAPRPGIDCVVGDVLESGSLDRTVQAVDAVINLVGAVHQPTTRAHFDLHKTGARRVAEAAAGAGRLIHVSALGVAGNAPSAADRSIMTDKVAVAGLPGLGDPGVRPRVLRDWLEAPGGRYGSAPAD